MAFFGVTVETIAKVVPIEGANTVELVVLEGLDFEVMVPKETFVGGERCLYFPLDSVLPEELSTKMGIKSKLGRTGRVKTLKVLGHISQGIVEKTESVPTEVLEKGAEDITAYLGVTKYEVTEETRRSGCNLPYGLSPYDIEGAERNKDLVEKLLAEQVLVTEKLEGSNLSVVIGLDRKVFVNTRRNISSTEEEGVSDDSDKLWSNYWVAAKKANLINFAKHLFHFYGQHSGMYNFIAVYGELLGPKIQGNLYKLTDYTVRIFDINIDGSYWMHAESMMAEIQAFFGSLDVMVPILHIGNLYSWLRGKTIKEASNGESELTPGVRREGVVLRPLVEQEVQGFGRLILKQRSPEYLARSKL